jgi:hypothetical protein
MNNTPGSSIEELQRQVRSLRILFLATLGVLVLLSFALNVFIFRQVSLVSRQLDENQKFVADYNQVTLPMIADFLPKLAAFSKTNAEIGRLLAKYNIQQTVAKPGASMMPANLSLTPATAPKQ